MEKPTSSGRADIGFLLIALLTLFQLIIWKMWEILTKSIEGVRSEAFYKVVMILSTFLEWGMFIIMIAFVRNQVFRIIIIFVFLINIVFSALRLYETFERF